MRLSILICSTHTRSASFLPRIMKSIFDQYNALPASAQKEVEILVLVDNKKMMLGEKRNELVDMAQGEYIAFVDDDDRISDNYLKELLMATDTGADVITFQVSVTINGGQLRLCYYSREYEIDRNTATEYFRIPNHICCVKTDISRRISFPNISYGEDSAYSKLLLPHLKTEHQIPEVLYYYDFSEETTETQQHIKANKLRDRKNPTPIIADVIILSNASSELLYGYTQNAVNTCLSGANGLKVNITVLEQNHNSKYVNASTVYMDAKFNYNAFANIGARMGTAGWIVIANNDLIFHDGWLHQLIAANHLVVSPKCPADARQTEITSNTGGYINGKYFSGWCFMIHRSLYDKIGGFDEAVSFWCSDDAVLEQLKAINVVPMLVPGAHVTHLQSSTLKTLTRYEQDHLTINQVKVFNAKYGQNKFNWGT